MSTLTGNPKMAQFKRGLSVVAERAMVAVVKNFRNKIIGVILAGVLAPQASFAGGHGHGGMSHGGHHSSSGPSMKSFQRSNGPTKSLQGAGSKQTLPKSSSNFVKRQSSGNGTNKKVIAAKNGNTGVTGTGLPKGSHGTSAGKQRGTNIRDLMKVDPASKVAGQNGSNFSPHKFSKTELLAKYGVKNNGSLHKGNKSPSSNPKNPPKDSHSKHSDHWCHNGFPWLWGIYPPVGFYPSCPVVISQPTPVYVDAPVAVSESQPPVTQPLATQPATPEPANVTPTDATVSAPVPDATIPLNVDLVLEEVQLVEAATVSAGPAYRVKFRNQGTQAAGRFRVGAFAEHDNKLSDDSPQIVTEVASLAAGEASEVTLRLPVTAMRLISTSAAGANAFDQLLVIIDLDDSIVESEKSNNVVNIERTELEATAR